MSSTFTQYIINGILLPYDSCKNHYDKLEPYIDDPKYGLTVLYDGMCGKYVVIGELINKSEKNQPLEEITTIYENDFVSGTSTHLVSMFLDNLEIDSSEGNWGIHIVTHYR